MGSADDDLDIPSWLDTEFLRNIKLSADKESNLTIKKFYIKPAVPKGENFLGTLYRVEVEYAHENGSFFHKYFIIKTMPNTAATKEYLSQIKAFSKEAFIYESVFPKLNSIMKSTERDVSQFSAFQYKTDRPETIVLEDLKYLGYKMADRLKGLDLNHCVATLRKLARFHALSRKLYTTNPEVNKVLMDGFFMKSDGNYKLLQPFFKSKFTDLASEIGKWPTFEYYAEKIRGLSDNSYSIFIDSVTPTETSYNVLNDGDFWVNNIMFKYHPDTGEIEDVRFVDFQLSGISSPSLDLQHFINTSAADELGFEEREMLLRVYYEEFVKTAEDLNINSDVLSLSQLERDFEDKNLFGFIICCADLSDILAGSSNSLNNIHSENSDSNIDRRKRFREVFKLVLAYYGKKGVI